MSSVVTPDRETAVLGRVPTGLFLAGRWRPAAAGG